MKHTNLTEQTLLIRNKWLPWLHLICVWWIWYNLNVHVRVSTYLNCSSVKVTVAMIWYFAVSIVTSYSYFTGAGTLLVPSRSNNFCEHQLTSLISKILYHNLMDTSAKNMMLSQTVLNINWICCIANINV